VWPRTDRGAPRGRVAACRTGGLERGPGAWREVIAERPDAVLGGADGVRAGAAGGIPVSGVPVSGVASAGGAGGTDGLAVAGGTAGGVSVSGGEAR
jgi:hypothetical protein